MFSSSLIDNFDMCCIEMPLLELTQAKFHARMVERLAAKNKYLRAFAWSNWYPGVLSMAGMRMFNSKVHHAKFNDERRKNK